VFVAVEVVLVLLDLVGALTFEGFVNDFRRIVVAVVVELLEGAFVELCLLPRCYPNLLLKHLFSDILVCIHPIEQKLSLTVSIWLCSCPWLCVPLHPLQIQLCKPCSLTRRQLWGILFDHICYWFFRCFFWESFFFLRLVRLCFKLRIEFLLNFFAKLDFFFESKSTEFFIWLFRGFLRSCFIGFSLDFSDLFVILRVVSLHESVALHGDHIVYPFVLYRLSFCHELPICIY